MPIRWRLTLWYTGFLLLILCILGLFVYLFLDYSLTSEIDRNIEQQADKVIGSTRVVGSLPFFLRQVVLPDVEVFAAPDVFLQVMATNGDIAVKSNNLGNYDLPVPQQAMQEVLERGSSFITFSFENVDNQKLRMVFKPILLDGEIVGILQVARPLAPVYAALSQLRSVLVWGGLAAIIISLGLGWFISGRTLRPIRELTSDAKKIGEERDFQRRVRYQGPMDDLGELAITFNTMLGSLEKAYSRLTESLQAQKRFVADASHELRTPLTSIQGNVDFLIKTGSLHQENSLNTEVLADISSETKRLSRLVKDLLTLARADAGFSLEMVEIELLPLLEESTRQARHLVKGQDFVAELKEARGLVIKADGDYLKQMLLIFFDNAFKYTPAGKKVIFKVSVIDNEVVLIFQDEGPGIPETELPHLFERFFRVQNSRTGEGAGLGLAIAKWIIDQHQGRITVESAKGQGSVFSIYLPVLRFF